METDYRGGGDFPLEFLRYLNSAFASQGRAGSQWRTSYDRSIKLGGSEAAVERQDGQRWRFGGSGTGVWAPIESDARAVLERLANGGWQLRLDGAASETYDSSGRLVTLIDDQGLVQSLTYDTSGRLLQVSHSAGRSLSFVYDSRGRLIQMTDPAGQVTTYAYGEFDNLLSVTYPDDAVRHYHYEDTSLPVALTGITDENGDRYATYQYQADGRAIATGHAGGADLHTLTYNPDGSTTVTDPLGTQRTHNFTTILGVVKSAGQSQPGGSGCGPASSATTYDANGNIASRADFNGNKTCYAARSSKSPTPSDTSPPTTNTTPTAMYCA